MKTKLLFLLFVVFCNSLLAKPVVQFVSPSPNSKYVKTGSSVILRFDSKPDSRFLNENLIKISGSKSGVHKSNINISGDGFTLIFTPLSNFAFDETVSVTINPVKTNSDYSEKISYSFQTEKENILPSSLNILKDELKVQNEYYKNISVPFLKSNGNVPEDFPPISVSTNTNPSPGYFFLTNFSITGAEIPNYLMILDNSGNPVFYKKLDTAAYDFKKQPNGNLTYFASKTQKYYELNSNYQLVDSFVCGNGYSTDLHELRLYNNRHAFLMSYDPQRVNMAELYPRGDSNAIVVGLIVQELDENKNVIFQWRSWDYFNILDAKHTSFIDHVIDYVHGNAIDLCADGNIMISSRHLDEITKINRNTGAIIWRLGGKNNQFTYLNESHHFSHQHAVRELPNGNITLFDNGNYYEIVDPIHGRPEAPYSRVVEYRLNTQTMEVTKVWEYVNEPRTYGFAMGYAERLPNGNTVIGWGAGNPAITEVDAQGNKVFELSLPQNQVSYRALKDSWNPVPFGNELPKNYTLYQNYPNPFNPGTTIKFDVPELSDVKITVFNLLGQKIAEELRPNLTTGTYEYFFNGANISSGVYFYTMTSGSFRETKRMILVK
jgi:hypothetical protein